MNWHARLLALAAAAFSSLIIFPLGLAHAQRPSPEARRFEVPGFDFSVDGAWRKRTGQIRRARQALLRNRALQSLNAASPNQSKVTGNFNIPVVLIDYKNTPTPYTVAEYQDVLFSPAPTARPYSVKTYYEEISNGNITLIGSVFNPITSDSNSSYYEDGCNGIIAPNCQHALSSGVSARFRDLLVEVLTKANALGTIDWGLFDNDGADGLPNSGDDDGSVDFIAFIHPTVDGACGAPGIWAHRWTIASLRQSTAFQTSTPRTAGGGFIQINDYTIQSGLGGINACAGNAIMPIGTMAHETGHGFGIPDLYDTSQETEGIGEWGLMGSGNYALPVSPSGYDAWSLAELGWVTLDTLSTDRTVRLNAVQLSDTVLYVPLPGNDEYLLLENRDSLQSDMAQMKATFGRKKSPGLLVWHITPSLVTARSSSNTVNVGTIHGVALRQADGLNHLRLTSGGNRGDTGDPYPGSNVNRKVVGADNAGVYAGFVIDSIYREESAPGVSSPIVFRYYQRQPSLFKTNRAGGQPVIAVSIIGEPPVAVPDSRHELVIKAGASINLSAASPQIVGGATYTLQGWSNGGSPTQVIVSGSIPDTITANFTASYRLKLTNADYGSVSSDIPGNPDLLAGVMLPENTPVTLTATALPFHVFSGWIGDTTSTSATLVLAMGKPYDVQATFQTTVLVELVEAVNALLGDPCVPAPCIDAQQAGYLDLMGNNDGSYNLGDFLAFIEGYHLNPSNEVMQKLLSRPTISVPLGAPTTPKER